MSEREYLLSKARRQRRDAYATAAGVGGVATTAGLVAGGVPGMKDPNSDWGRLKQAKMPRTRADLKETSRHLGAGGRGGILGYRVAAHKHVLRETNAENLHVSGHGETTHHGHYARGVGYGKPAPERTIIRQMSRGRKIANRATLSGAALTAAGLYGLKGKEMAPRTREQRSSDRTRATGSGLMAAGGTTTAGALGGSAYLNSKGKKWARYSLSQNRAASRFAPGVGGVSQSKQKGTSVPHLSPHVKDDKMHTRPNAFAGRSKYAAERAGALRGSAKQGSYFAHVYGNTAKYVRRAGVPVGLATLGAGALVNATQKRKAR